MVLKEVLLEMGATLVDKHGFKRSNLAGTGLSLDQSTDPITKFIVWLESTPQAKQVLAQMGYAYFHPEKLKIAK